MTGDAGDRPASLAAEERAALIAAHERRLEALRHSVQYRVGELVIDGVRSPRRLVRLPLDLWRLRRELLARHRPHAVPASSDRPARDLVVTTILDQFSDRLLAPEWRQVPLPATGVAAAVARAGPALLFAETAWEGNGAAYRYDFAHFATRTGSPLRAALAAASDAGIPTVLWSKEDPVHLETFAAVAAAFDWVVTTDADCVERHRRLLGHDRVATMPFAAQPRLHHPLGGAAERLPRACFAGSWQADRYADRGADLEVLLRPVLDEGLLDIFDRMARPGAEGAPFPPPYDRAVLGARSYDELLREYHRYACFLNVNSVTTSPTMCSRRVFELLACYTPIVSTPSRAIEELLGDAVVTVSTPAEAREAVGRLVGDVEHRERVAHRGYRTVMAHHTYGHRVDDVLERLGLAAATRQPRVAVLAPTNRPEQLEALIATFTRQRDVDAELLVLTNAARFDRAAVDRRLADVAGARAIHFDEALTMGECLNAGLAATDARFVAKIDDDDHYGEWYLHDALLVHRFVDAAVVGKKTFYAHLEASDETILRFPGNELTVANRVSGSTLLVDRKRFGDVRFGALDLGEDADLCEQAHERGLTVYSADRFNYVAVRRRDVRSHSWSIDDDEYRNGSVRVGDGLALDRAFV